MNVSKIVAFITALIFGVSLASPVATPTDIDYVLGPLEIVDGSEEEADEIEPYVYIEIVNPNRTIYFGDEVTMRCIVVGLDGMDYSVQWQYSTEALGEDYQDIDCTEEEYTFVADYSNVGYYYRVRVSY